MIKKFEDFNINESVLYFSPDFKETLKEIDSDISKRLLNLEGSDIKPDTSFIDFSEETGFLKFQTMNKAHEKIRKTYTSLDMQNHPDVGINASLHGVVDGLYRNNKNKIKTGRFLRGAMPEVDEREIEKFAQVLTAYQNPDSTNLRLVSGDEIKYWYDIDNYYSKKDGNLAKSCMADVQFFDLYAENPEVCKLLILTQKEKLIARGLVWKLNSCDEIVTNSANTTDKKNFKKPLNAQYFLDRAYGLREFHEQILINYAKAQGWAYREGGVKWGGIVYFDGNSYKDIEMTVKIKKKEYNTWPHLDTFVRYDYVTGLLHNDSKKDERGYLLNRVTGVYTKNPRNFIDRFGDFFEI
jgi:hypothetical protein